MIEDLWNVYQTIDDPDGSIFEMLIRILKSGGGKLITDFINKHPDGLTLSDVAAFLDSIGA